MRSLVLLIMLIALPIGSAVAGELDTHLRAGDRVFYRVACVSVDITIKVLRAADRLHSLKPPSWREAIERGQCFDVGRFFPATLREWLAGPFHLGPDKKIVSAWRFENRHGDELFGWWPDNSGPHQPVIEPETKT